MLVLPGRSLGGQSDSSADATGGKLTGGSSSSSMVWARVLAVRPETGAVRVARGRGGLAVLGAAALPALLAVGVGEAAGWGVLSGLASGLVGL